MSNSLTTSSDLFKDHLNEGKFESGEGGYSFHEMVPFSGIRNPLVTNEDKDEIKLNWLPKFVFGDNKNMHQLRYIYI